MRTGKSPVFGDMTVYILQLYQTRRTDKQCHKILYIKIERVNSGLEQMVMVCKFNGVSFYECIIHPDP